MQPSLPNILVLIPKLTQLGFQSKWDSILWWRKSYLKRHAGSKSFDLKIVQSLKCIRGKTQPCDKSSLTVPHSMESRTISGIFW
jgi:hypothetical protein